MLCSSSQDLQHAQGEFAAECKAAKMRLGTSKSEAIVRKMVVCPLQVGEQFLPQMEELNYLGVLFTSEGKMECEVDRQIDAEAAVMWSLCWSFLVKKELSRKVKTSICELINVPTFTYG